MSMAFGYKMMLSILIVPLLMIGFGLLFIKKPPKRINALYGYRTRRSMRNQDTWDFAHQYCGKIWLVCGLLSILPSLIPIWLVVGKSEHLISMTGSIVLGIQVLLLLATLIPTERALNNNFDEFGRPR